MWQVVVIWTIFGSMMKYQLPALGIRLMWSFERKTACSKLFNLL
jgi:hypothetical protein